MDLARASKRKMRLVSPLQQRGAYWLIARIPPVSGCRWIRGLWVTAQLPSALPFLPYREQQRAPARCHGPETGFLCFSGLFGSKIRLRPNPLKKQNPARRRPARVCRNRSSARSALFALWQVARKRPSWSRSRIVQVTFCPVVKLSGRGACLRAIACRKLRRHDAEQTQIKIRYAQFFAIDDNGLTLNFTRSGAAGLRSATASLFTGVRGILRGGGASCASAEPVRTRKIRVYKICLFIRTPL